MGRARIVHRCANHRARPPVDECSTPPRDLFVEQGYTTTTVAEIAAAAEVSPQTIYKSLGGKSGLLEAIIDEAAARAWRCALRTADVVGRDRRVAVSRRNGLRPTWPRAAACSLAPDRSTPSSVGRWVARRSSTTCAHDSFRPGSNETPRISGPTSATPFDPGSRLREAAQRYFAISSPELYDLMTQQLGWSVAHHQRWLAETAARDLLGPT